MSRPTSTPSVPTFGVEEEFLLVDATTGLPAEVNLAVAEAARTLGLKLSLEFAGCQVEIDTSVHSSSAELQTELFQLRNTLSEAASRSGALLLAAAVPPVGVARFTLTDTARFDLIRESFGRLTYGQCVCGCHVHVGMPDRETALQVSNFIRPWLPALLSLTANSAVYGGGDSGHASWRAVLQSQWPVSGPPPYFRSVQHYEHLIDVLTDSGAILEEHMAYWDIRPSSHLPTLEIRVSDVPATVEETVTLATVIRALAMTALQELSEGRTAPEIGAEILTAAKWKAAHDGLRGEGYDLLGERTVPARSVVHALIATVAPALEELGELGNVSRSLRRRFADGNGAVLQQKALQSGGIEALIRAIGDVTVQQTILPAFA